MPAITAARENLLVNVFLLWSVATRWQAVTPNHQATVIVLLQSGQASEARETQGSPIGCTERHAPVPRSNPRGAAKLALGGPPVADIPGSARWIRGFTPRESQTINNSPTV